jgi:pyroglutamyl-peptidase
MKIVLTAFEPFDHRDTNSSLEVVNAFPPTIEGHQIKKVVLPVIYENFACQDLFNEKDIDLLILCGEAAEREKIALEVVSVNMMYASIPDNNGVYKNGSKIVDDGPNAYFSNIDLLEVNKQLHLPSVYLSFTAGTFICNLCFYQAMHRIKIENKDTLCCFIHFPRIKTHDFEKGIDLEAGISSLMAIIHQIIHTSNLS